MSYFYKLSLFIPIYSEAVRLILITIVRVGIWELGFRKVRELGVRS
jgi:hypothetical protein